MRHYCAFIPGASPVMFGFFALSLNECSPPSTPCAQSPGVPRPLPVLPFALLPRPQIASSAERFEVAERRKTSVFPYRECT